MADEPNKDDKANRVDPRLLEILVCPRTKTSLLYDEVRQELISRAGTATSLAEIEPRSTAVVIGNGARVEIWAEGRWDSYSTDALDRFTEFADKVINRP